MEEEAKYTLNHKKIKTNHTVLNYKDNEEMKIKLNIKKSQAAEDPILKWTSSCKWLIYSKKRKSPK